MKCRHRNNLHVSSPVEHLKFLLHCAKIYLLHNIHNVKWHTKVIINDLQNDEYKITDKRKLNLVNHYTAYADNNIDGEYYLPLQRYLTVEIVNEPVFGKLFMVCLTFIYGERWFQWTKRMLLKTL